MNEYVENPPQLEHGAALRRTSDEFLRRLDRLLELETHKREMAPDAPEFVRIAREVEDLSRALLHTGVQQVELAEEVHYEAKRSDVAVDQSIRATPPRRAAVAVLDEWRAAERRLSAAAAGSDEESEVRADIERLRQEYQRLTAPIQLEPEGQA